jgi:hypothetical protein
LYFVSVIIDGIVSSLSLSALLPSILDEFSSSHPPSVLDDSFPIQQLLTATPQQLQNFKQIIKINKFGKGNNLFS